MIVGTKRVYRAIGWDTKAEFDFNHDPKVGRWRAKIWMARDDMRDFIDGGYRFVGVETENMPVHEGDDE